MHQVTCLPPWYFSKILTFHSLIRIGYTNVDIHYGKGKGHPRTGHEDPQGENFLSFLNLGARQGRVFNATPRPLYPQESDQVPIVQEAGSAPVSVWTGAENLTPTDIRSPDRPARIELLHWHLLLHLSKVKSPYLIMHHAIKAYGEVDYSSMHS